jgi:hypothetical protein
MTLSRFVQCRVCVNPITYRTFTFTESKEKKMSFKNLISATVLTVGFGMAPYVHAGFAETPVEADVFSVLSTHDWKNDELQSGNYDFGQVHIRTGKTFNDVWGFSFAEDTTASLSVYDLEVPTSGGALTQSQNHQSSKKSYSSLYTGKLLDNKFLSFSLFDGNGNLLGSAGEDASLTNLALHAGEWYTLSVSAQVNGLLGSVYHGTLSTLATTPNEVPLGDSLPFFASGLGLLALRYRKHLQPQR